MITKTKNQILAEMVQRAGVNPLKVLGSDAEETPDGVEESEYKVPRTKKDLAPKTPANLKKRADGFRKAIANIDAALKELAKIPAVDFMGDIAYFQEQLKQLVDGEGGEGGMRPLAKEYDQEAKKGA